MIESFADSKTEAIYRGKSVKDFLLEKSMVTKNVEKTVVFAKDGTPLSIMERPDGLGTFADYHRKVQKYREQHAHLLDKQSFDDFLKERKEDAAREWE